MLDLLLFLNGNLYNSHLFLKLLTIVTTFLILISVIVVLYVILVYCVLIRFNFIRELLKEFGLPIPIESIDT
jgi:hypothetical protein